MQISQGNKAFQKQLKRFSPILPDMFTICEMETLRQPLAVNRVRVALITRSILDCGLISPVFIIPPAVRLKALTAS